MSSLILSGNLKKQKLFINESCRGFGQKKHNYDDEKQKEIDASLLEDRLRNPQKAFYYMEQAKKDFPDRVEEIEALSKLYIALDIMKSTSTISADGWLLHVLKYFYELYQQYPDISDANALIQFIKKEEVIKSAEELDLLPQETRERLDLNFSENLKPFIEQYALTIATKADNILQNTEHSNSVNQFKERVAKDSDGFYRWIYDRKERNPDMKWYLRVLFMKFFKRIVLLFGVMWVLSMIYSTLIIGIPMSAVYAVRMVVSFLVLILLITAFVIGIPYLISIKDYYSYELGNNGFGVTCIKSSLFPLTPIRNYKEIACYPEKDMIILGDNLVFVPSEDYQMVKEYILAQASPKAKVRQ